jgi:hypothetical protein
MTFPLLSLFVLVLYISRLSVKFASWLPLIAPPSGNREVSHVHHLSSRLDLLIPIYLHSPDPRPSTNAYAPSIGVTKPGHPWHNHGS